MLTWTHAEYLTTLTFTQSPPPGRVCGVIDQALFPHMQKESIRLLSRQPYFLHAGFLYRPQDLLAHHKQRSKPGTSGL